MSVEPIENIKALICKIHDANVLLSLRKEGMISLSFNELPVIASIA